MTTNQIVAHTILEQLGGNRFAAMTGAKNFACDESSLQFSIGRNSHGINKVRVTLEASDTYTVEFFKIRKLDAKLVERCNDIYADQLQDVFRCITGLDTHL